MLILVMPAPDSNGVLWAVMASLLARAVRAKEVTALQQERSKAPTEAIELAQVVVVC